VHHYRFRSLGVFSKKAGEKFSADWGQARPLPGAESDRNLGADDEVRQLDAITNRMDVYDDFAVNRLGIRLKGSTCR